MAGKKRNIDQIIKAFEKKQERLMAKTMADIMTLFDSKASDLAFLYAKRRLIGNRFLPADIRQTIERVTNTVNVQTREILVNSIKSTFRNSDQKNTAIAEVASGGRRVPPGRRTRAASAAGGNKKGTITAVDAFIKRKEGGLNLSARVFKLSNSYKKAISDTMIEGLKNGTSARDLAKDMRANLRNNKFQQHPGRGVYKSPFKNAMRLTRNENNLAYASADFDRWQLIESVIGIEVKLSNRHPKYDVCDEMKGVYPKTFQFTKWHVNCLCVAIPKLASQEDRNKIMDYKLGLTDSPPVLPYVKDIPESAKGWIRKNVKRVDRWKSKPIWFEKNRAVVANIRSPEGLKDFRTPEGMQANIDLANEGKRDSLQLYTDGNGQLLPFRKNMHDNIVDDMIGQGSTETGVVYMLGGAPANGKSALVDSGFLPHPKGILKIDPDELKAKIPEYTHLVKQMDSKAASFVHEESSLIGKRVITKALSKNWDVLNDGVGDGEFAKLDEKLDQYRRAGKRMRADYVSLDTDLSLRLAEARAKKTGREVPTKYILDMNREISKLVPQLVEHKSFDELYLWDTNQQGKPRLILSQVDGKLKIFDKKLYQQFLDKAKR